MKIRVELEDYEACVKASKNYSTNKKKGHFGKGCLNTKGDPHAVERIGLLAEMAFGKATGLIPDLSYKPKGDNYDFKVGKMTLDIKASFTKSGKNLIKTNSPMKSMVYVCSWVDESKAMKYADVYFVGYFLREDVRLCPIEKGIGDWFNFKLEWKEAQDIETLVNTIKKVKGEK